MLHNDPVDRGGHEVAKRSALPDSRADIGRRYLHLGHGHVSDAIETCRPIGIDGYVGSSQGGERDPIH